MLHPRPHRAPGGRGRLLKFRHHSPGCYHGAARPKGAPLAPLSEPTVRLIPLGGLGEIGLNMMLVESGDDLIAVDCGLMFPDADELPGIDRVIPDFTYALAKRDGFRAVFLTHGHEDHIGALPYLLGQARVPVFGTPLTLALVAEGVLGLCSDSTNVDRPGHTRSEVEVGRALAERFARAPGRIIVATFASHIHRIQQVLTLAATQGRRVALLGMSMQKNVAIAAELGYLGVPADLLVPLEELASLEPARQVILSTGSQGEPNSALALMAAAEHKYVQVQPGDLVIISARVIPGNERTIGRVVNALYRLGAEVLYEDNAFVHVSGHASQEDLKLMLNLTRPRYFIPVHGEYRHLLGHARLAESVGLEPDGILLIEDGTGVEVTKTAAHVVGRFPAGRVLVDGKSVGEVGAVVLRDRQLLAEDGLIAVSIAMNRSGAVVAGPEIASRGFVYAKENEALLDELKAVVLAAVAEGDAEAAFDRAVVGARVRAAVRHFVHQRFRRRPVVLPIILEV